MGFKWINGDITWCLVDVQETQHNSEYARGLQIANMLFNVEGSY